VLSKFLTIMNVRARVVTDAFKIHLCIPLSGIESSSEERDATSVPLQGEVLPRGRRRRTDSRHYSGKTD